MIDLEFIMRDCEGGIRTAQRRIDRFISELETKLADRDAEIERLKALVTRQSDTIHEYMDAWKTRPDKKTKTNKNRRN